jgi:hypothetical protein
MKAQQQRGNSRDVDHEKLIREEGFWPFDDWDPEDDNGKTTGEFGDGSGSSPIKNYPSSIRREDEGTE